MIEKFLSTFEKLHSTRNIYLPHVWSEKKIKMDSSITSLPGPLSYNITPYLKEIVDTIDKRHPARFISIMKGAQQGLSQSVIVPAICYRIENDPCSMVFLSANDELSRKFVTGRLDPILKSSGVSRLIRPNVIRKRNQRTGDTDKSKEFAGGSITFGGLQSFDKLGKQSSYQIGFYDDFESAPISDRDQGNTFELLEQRFSAGGSNVKIYIISTPETRPSNIEQMYLLGDQRKWFVPCPVCGAMIELHWFIKKENEFAGISYKTDKAGDLIESSVGYVCQECAGFFKEKNKYEMNLSGEWKPTAKPFRSSFYSYHLNALYAAPFMFGWTDYVYKWLRTFNSEHEPIKSKRKVFYNVVLGLPWEEKKTEIRSINIAKNTRKYQIGVVPDKLSKDDGNGNIVLLTCSCDLNGHIDDARLDYEVMAHAENGSTYSVDHGSIGTFQRGKTDKEEDNRIKWTYRNEKENNVWDQFWNEVVNKDYGEYKIMICGVDTGYFTHFAYHFIDEHPEKLIGLKGETIKKTQKIDKDIAIFKAATERARLFLLKTDKIKDDLSERIDLKWSKNMPQPPGFMNFPEPSDGKYTINSFFSHYEAEEKKIETNDDGEAIGWMWDKKHSGVANHFWDCAVYNLAIRDIIAQKACKEFGIKSFAWSDFAEVMRKIIEGG